MSCFAGDRAYRRLVKPATLAPSESPLRRCETRRSNAPERSDDFHSKVSPGCSPANLEHACDAALGDPLHALCVDESDRHALLTDRGGDALAALAARFAHAQQERVRR